MKRRTKTIMLLVVLFVLLPSIYLVIKVSQYAQISAVLYARSNKFPAYPTIDTRGLSHAEALKIKHGEYIVKAGDCIACHTNAAAGGKAFAGGLPMVTPFGTIYTPNITPDKETGIGNWTEADLEKALHEGISPTGYYYFPAFPYLYFSKITHDDVLAIKAYLERVPAVKQENKNNEMLFPFSWRFLQLGWRILFFYPEQTGPYQVDPEQSQQWNRGAYIVEGPGHCAMCHTPSYYIISPKVSLGAPIRKYNLTGADIEGYLAPNISKSNLGAIPDSELLKIFTQYKLIGGAPVQGPMYEAIHDSLKQLHTQDLLAIITYLKTVESEIPGPTTGKASDVGKSIYNSYCAGCHASGVGGAPRVGDKQSWQSLANSGMEKLYEIAINGGGNMPARGTCITCTDQEIRDAVDYMVSR